jgi:RHS repeat-associated protein
MSNGKPVTVDSTASSSYPGSNAVDGNISSDTSRWMSANTTSPHYIIVDFGAEYYINQVKFYTGSGGYNSPIPNYAIQKWNGTSWVDIVSRTGNTNSQVIEQFTTTITSKIRLYNNPGVQIKLYEIQVYGAMAPTSYVQLDVDKTSAVIGDIIAADLKVKNAANLSGFQVSLNYDPSILQPVDDNMVPYEFNTIPSGRTVLNNTNYNINVHTSNWLSSGVIDYLCSYTDLNKYRTTGPSENTGSLGKIKFKVINAGSVNISLANSVNLPDGKDGVYIYDWNGNRIDGTMDVIQPFTQTSGMQTLLSTAFSAPLAAQTASASATDLKTTLTTATSCKISGYIKPDSDNDIVDKSGFLIELKDTSGNTLTSVTTDSSGYFEFINQIPGYYDIKISKTDNVNNIKYVNFYIKNFATIFENNLISTKDKPIYICRDLIYSLLPSDSVINQRDLASITTYMSSSNPYDPKYDLNQDSSVNLCDLMILIRNIFQGYNAINSNCVHYLDSNQELNSLVMTNHSIDLNGYTLNIINDFLSSTPQNAIPGQPGNSIFINIDGGRLIVGGDMHLHGLSSLIMRNAYDYVLVKGEFLMNSRVNHLKKQSDFFGDFDPCLTNGLLEVKGNFREKTTYNLTTYINHCNRCNVDVDYGDPYNFAATGNHTVKLSGEAKQTVEFERVVVQSNVDQSHFQNLIITKPLETGYEFILSPGSKICWVNLNEAFADGLNIDNTPDENVPGDKFGTAAVTVDAKIYMFNVGAHFGFNTINVYDPLIGKWTAEYTTNNNREGFVAVAPNNKNIYIIGGRDNFHALNAIEVFSPSTGVITSLSDSALSYIARSEACAVAVGDKIYLMGGATYLGDSKSMQVFDTTNNMWTDCPSLPSERRGSSAVYYNGKIYVLGGYTYGQNGSIQYHESMEVFDIASGNWSTVTWTEATGKFSKRSNFSATAVNGKIVVLCGFDGKDHLATSQIYNIAENKWQTPTENSSIPPIIQKSVKNVDGTYSKVNDERSQFGSAMVYSQIYMVGGFNKNGVVQEVNKVYPILLPGATSYDGLGLNPFFKGNQTDKRIVQGNYTTNVSDIKIASNGLPIELVRTYDSSDNYSYDTDAEEKPKRSLLGNGWRLNYDSYLAKKTVPYYRLTGSGVYVRSGAGTSYKILATTEVGVCVKKIGEPVKDVDGTSNRMWCKVSCIIDSNKIIEGYISQQYLSVVSNGAEVKVGAGSSVVFDGDSFKAPYGCYDKLSYNTSTQEYTLSKPDATKYVFKKVTGDATDYYRLYSVSDKFGNSIIISGSWTSTNGYRINTVTETCGRNLSFSYGTNTITVKDNANRSVTYTLTGGNLTDVTNIYGERTGYTYVASGNEAGLDNKNLNKLKQISIYEKQSDGSYIQKTILTNSYNSVTGRRYKETDAYGKVRYWICLDSFFEEANGTYKGTVERQYYDENNIKTVTQYEDYLKQPKAEIYADGSVVKHKYFYQIGSNWVKSTDINASNYASLYGTVSRQYDTNRYGLTCLEERDINGNVVKQANGFIDSSTGNQMPTVPNGTLYKKYSYTYLSSYNASMLTNQCQMREGSSTVLENGYVNYTYEGTNTKPILKSVSKRIDSSKGLFATTDYTYYPDASYTVKGLINTVKDPDGNTVTYVPNSTNCYYETIKDPLLQATSYQYDAVGRKVSETTPMKYKTEYRYIDNGKVIINIKYDAAGNKKSVAISINDGFGHTIKDISPIQYKKQKSLSDIDTITRAIIDGMYGNTYTYYLTGKLNQKTIKNPTKNISGSEILNTTDIIYTYDNAGNLLTETVKEDSTFKQQKVYEYNNMNQIYRIWLKSTEDGVPVLLEENVYKLYRFGNRNMDVKIHRVFYYNNTPTTYSLADKDAYEQTTVTMDYLQKVEETTQLGKATIVKQYYDDGTLQYIQNGDNSDNTTTFAYDGLGRVTRKRVPMEYSGINVLTALYKYTYYNSGRINTEEIGNEKVLNNVDPSTFQVKTYKYTACGQLSEISIPEGTIKKYTYDTDGNVNKESSGISSIITSDVYYISNYLGKPATAYHMVKQEDVPDAPTVNGAIVTDYGYDENGNVISASTETCAYNSTTGVESSRSGKKTVLAFEYDDLGRQIKSSKTGIVFKAGSSLTDTYANITETKSLDTLSTYTWDGKPSKVKDPNGNIVNYYYEYGDKGAINKVHQVVTKTDPDGVPSYVIVTKASYYDWAGRLIAEVSPENYVDGKTLTELNRYEYKYFIYNNLPIFEKRYVGNLKQFDASQITATPSVTAVNIVLSRVEYDEFGNVVKEFTGDGYIKNKYTYYEYDIQNNIRKVYDPETQKFDAYGGRITTFYNVKFDYDTMGRVISDTKMKGYSGTDKFAPYESTYYVKTQYKYNYSGNLLKKWVKKGTTEAISILETETPVLNDQYDLTGNCISHIDANGYTTDYAYNDLLKAKSVTYPIDSTLTYGSTSRYKVDYQYNSIGNLIKQSDNLQKVQTYEYDTAERVIKETLKKSDDTESKVTRAIYDSNGNKRFDYYELTSGKSFLNEYIYDGMNRLEKMITKTSDVDGIVSDHITHSNYDNNDNPVAITTIIKNSLTFKSVVSSLYDELGRLIEKKDNDQSVQKLIYNNDSNQIYSFNANNYKTSFTYDNNGRLIVATDPLGHTKSQGYDYAGNVRINTDGKNNKTYFVYDENDRLGYVINKVTIGTTLITQKTLYTYDKNGNMLTQQVLNFDLDTPYKTLTYEYNALGKMTKCIDDGGVSAGIYDYTKVQWYKYDPEGNLRLKYGRSSVSTDSTGSNAAVTTYNYYVDGNLKDQTTTKSGLASISILYKYDENGNLTQLDDITGTTTRTYDELNRAKTKNVPEFGLSKYKYDIITTDGMTSESITDPKSNNTTRVYDKSNRLKYVYDSADQSKKTTYNYYPDGALQNVTYPGSNTEDYIYYADGLVNTLINKAAGSQIETYTYTYDAAHNLQTKTESIKSLNNGTQKVTSYSYDELNRLKKVVEPGKTTEYTFDCAGNRKTESINGTKTTTYNYDKRNRITSTVNEVTLEQTVYDYQDNVNTLVVKVGGVPKATYVYDVLDRLITATAGSVTTNYTYNGEGRRVKKSSSSATTKYLYEYDKVVLELDGNGNVVARNLYGTNLVMRVVGVQPNAQSYYYMYNLHGDVTALINTSTYKADATYYYDAFGNLDPAGTTGIISNSITYAGYQYDKETGLYYCNSRMYDPKIARFLQEDTYTGDPNDPLSLNLYTYCNNEPMMYTDPTGHFGENQVLHKSSTGSDVAEVQRRLKELGYLGFDPNYKAGEFGSSTEAALVKFKADNGLLDIEDYSMMAKVDYKTWQNLHSDSLTGGLLSRDGSSYGLQFDDKTNSYKFTYNYNNDGIHFGYELIFDTDINGNVTRLSYKEDNMGNRVSESYVRAIQAQNTPTQNTQAKSPSIPKVVSEIGWGALQTVGGILETIGGIAMYGSTAVDGPVGIIGGTYFTVNGISNAAGGISRIVNTIMGNEKGETWNFVKNGCNALSPDYGEALYLGTQIPGMVYGGYQLAQTGAKLYRSWNASRALANVLDDASNGTAIIPRNQGFGISAKGVEILNSKQLALHEKLIHSTDIGGVPLKPGEIGFGDVAALTRATGLEHGVVRLNSGERLLIRGTSKNIPIAGKLDVKRLIVHSHPGETPYTLLPSGIRGVTSKGKIVSGGDIEYLWGLGQRYSYIVTSGTGRVGVPYWLGKFDNEGFWYGINTPVENCVQGVHPNMFGIFD